jgi:hypothetical protein
MLGLESKIRRVQHAAALFLTVACVCAASSPAPVAAEDNVQGEVLVILAKAEPGPVDAKLAGMPALRKPPFDGYKSMSLLSTTPVTLSSQRASISDLPKGRKLMLRLLGSTRDGRHRVEVSINKPGKQDYLPLLTVLASKEPFFVAGQSFKGGTLIIGVRLTR